MAPKSQVFFILLPKDKSNFNKTEFGPMILNIYKVLMIIIVIYLFILLLE